MRDQNTKAQDEKKIIRWYPPPVLSPTPQHKSTTPHQSHPHIICNNNTMDMALLVQMKQSNKCRSVRNDEKINLPLGSGADPWVSISCLLHGTSHIYWFHLPKKPTSKKRRIQNWDSTSNKLYCTAMSDIHRTQEW